MSAADASSPPTAAVDPSAPALDTRDETVRNTLVYLCYHHYGKEENLLHSPLSLKKVRSKSILECSGCEMFLFLQRHTLGEAQYCWAALAARAQKGDWKACEELATTKGWMSFGAKKKVLRLVMHARNTPNGPLSPRSRQRLTRSPSSASSTSTEPRPTFSLYTSRSLTT